MEESNNDMSEKFSRFYNSHMNMISNKTKARWAVWIILYSYLTLRILIFTHDHIAIYYLISCHIAKSGFLFITPRGIPSIFDEEEFDDVSLPSGSHDMRYVVS